MKGFGCASLPFARGSLGVTSSTIGAACAAAFIALLAWTGCAGRRTSPAKPGAALPLSAAPRAPSSLPVAISTSATTQELLAGIEAAYRDGRYDDGLALVKRTLETGRKDLSVIDRVGSVYYLLGRYGEALALWEQALRLEKRRRRREDLERSIVLARLSLGIPAPKTAKPVSAKPPRRTPRGKANPEAIDWFYDQGVAHYAKGEYLQAASAFMRVLELDPEHALSKSALVRLKLKPGATDTGKSGNPG